MPEGDGAQGAGGDKTFSKAEVDDLVSGLKTKNTELLGSMSKLKDQLKPWEGLEAEKVRQVLADHEKTVADRQKAQGDWEAREAALREQFKTEHEKVTGPLQSEVESLRSNLFDAVAVRDAMEAMADPEIKANPKLILPVVRSELAVELIEGKHVTVIRGADGKPRYHPTTNKLVTVKDRLQELRGAKEFAGGFEGAGGSGSGAQGSQGDGAAGAVRLTREQASDARVYDAALKQVGGDHSKIKVDTAA